MKEKTPKRYADKSIREGLVSGFAKAVSSLKLDVRLVFEENPFHEGSYYWYYTGKDIGKIIELNAIYSDLLMDDCD